MARTVVIIEALYQLFKNFYQFHPDVKLKADLLKSVVTFDSSNIRFSRFIRYLYIFNRKWLYTVANKGQLNLVALPTGHKKRQSRRL